MTDTKLDLEIVRLVAAPREKVWRAWSDPDILKQWWCPKPWVTDVRAFDFRSGGAFHTFMSGPDGGESDNPGLFLDVVPMERIVEIPSDFEGVVYEPFDVSGGWKRTLGRELEAAGYKIDWNTVMRS